MVTEKFVDYLKSFSNMVVDDIMIIRKKYLNFALMKNQVIASLYKSLINNIWQETMDLSCNFLVLAQDGKIDSLKKIDFAELNKRILNNVFKSGSLYWKFETKGYIWSSPAIDDEGNVYFGSSDGCLYSLTSDGVLRFVFPTNSSGISVGPTIGNDNTIYFCDYSNLIYALSQNGNLKWKFQANSYISDLITGNNGNIYFTCGDKKLYCLSKDGKFLWNKSFKNVINSTLAVDSNLNIYLGDKEGKVYLCSLRTKNEKVFEIFQATGSVDSQIALSNEQDGGTLYFVCRDGYLYAVRTTGELKWKVKLIEKDIPGFSKPDNLGYLYYYSGPVLGHDGTVYVGDFEGGINAISSNGKLLWKYKTNGPVRSTPLVTQEGIIYVGSADGNLYALTINGDFLWSFYSQNGFGSSPTIGRNGVIYVGSWDGNLYAIFSSSSKPAGVWPKYKYNLKNSASVQ